MGSKENIFPVSVCMCFKIKMHSSETIYTTEIKCKAFVNDDSILLGNQLKKFKFKSVVSNFTKTRVQMKIRLDVQFVANVIVSSKNPHL